MALATLTIDMVAKLANLERDMGRAAHLSEQAANRMDSAFSKVGNTVRMIGGALSIGAFSNLIKGSIDAADQLNDLSQKVGISIESLAGWKLAAEQSGTSLESVAKGVKGLSGYMVEHADKLKKLGITATGSSGAMIQLADVFAKLPDGLTKTALAVDVFGKAGMDMIPMLNLGSRGLSEAQEKAAEYGRRMKELAPDADKFNDQLAELSLQASLVGMILASKVTGPMAQWLEAQNESIRIAGSATEAQRLFVFNIDAMTSEKPVEELERLTKALKDYQAASALGKFMQSPTGTLFGGREDDLKKQIAYLEFLKKQEERTNSPPKITSPRTAGQAAAAILEQRAFAAEVRKILGEDVKVKIKVDRNVTDLLLLQDEMRKVALAAEGLDPFQIKLYEMAAHGATSKQLRMAEAAVNTINKINDESEALKQLNAAHEETSKHLEKINSASAEEMNQMRFDTSLIGLNVLEIQKRTEARRIDMALEKELLSLRVNDKYKTRDKNPAVESEYQAAVDATKRSAEATKEGALQEIEARDSVFRAWSTGANSAINKYVDDISNVAKTTEGMVVHAFKGMEDSLVSFATTGKLNFASLADSVIADLIRIQIQQSVMPGVLDIINSLRYSNTGGMSGMNPNTPVMSPSYTPPAFASGGVFDSATQFRFASGGAFRTGILGEAGPEAVMPLSRDKSGRLGVKTQGGGGVVVNVIESSDKGGQVQQRNEGGVSITDVFVSQVKSVVTSDISRGGDISVALARTYGLNRGAGAVR